MELLMVLGSVFIIGALVLLTSRRTGLPTIPALIFSGLIISFLANFEGLSQIIVLGISFLVFYIGLRTDLDGFRKVSSDSLNISLVQVLFLFVFVTAGALYLEFSLVDSLYIALAGSLASTLAGTDIFDRSLRMDLHHGQISTASNFIHDILGVIIIAFLAAGVSSSGLNTAIITMGLLAFAFVVRELISSRFHRLIDSAELKVVTMVALYSAAVGFSQITGLSLIAVSFAAGLMFSRGSETEEFLDVLEPLKDFFSVILFVGLGMLISIHSTRVLIITAVLIVASLILRPLIVSMVMMFDGHSGRKAFKTSSSMMQVSEFSLAAVILAWMSGTITTPVFEAVVLSTALTMTVSSIVIQHSEILYEKIGLPIRKIEDLLEYRVNPIDLDNHVVVIGYDVKGRKIVESLLEKERDVLVIDYNAENIDELKKENIPHIFSDVLEDRTLEAANIQNAELLISSSNHRPVLEKLGSLSVSKLLIVEDKDQEEEFSNQDSEILVESELVENALKRKISELIG